MPAASTAAAPSKDSSAANCCSTGLWGWSPPLLPADTPLKRRLDAVFPRSSLSAVLFFAGVIVLLNVGSLFSARTELASTGMASLAAGAWCSLNFWRCRHAHCLITGSGWLALGGLASIEAPIERSLIRGEEGLVFVAILFAGLAFEASLVPPTWHERDYPLAALNPNAFEHQTTDEGHEGSTCGWQDDAQGNTRSTSPRGSGCRRAPI